MAARSLTRAFPVLGLCLTFGISSVLWAQDSQQQQARPDQQQAGQQSEQKQTKQEQDHQKTQAGQKEVLDVLLASWLIGDNNVEVQLSRLAIDRSQNEQVRQFAQRMIQEHDNLIDQLHRVGMGVEPQEGQQSQQLRQQQQQQQASQPQQPKQSQLTQQRQSQSGERQAGYRPQANEQQAHHARSTPSMQLLSIHKEMGDQFVAMMRKELQAKQGAEFDRAFMGSQIFAHNHMLATIEAMQEHASPELKPMLQQAANHVQQHLKEARDIAQQLEPGTAATASQPERGETQRQ